MAPLLEVSHLVKNFGGVAAISELHFSVPAGSIYAVIGPNGAGKTTLFNLLTGIYTPTKGQIQFNQAEITGKAPHKISRLGISRTFQTPQVFHSMTALENVLVGCHRHGKTNFIQAALRLPGVAREEEQIKEQALEALRFCHLDHFAEEDADALPYGAQKRLEVARALATQPDLLLMDEPAAGLNDTETAEMSDLIHRIRDANKTVMLVEHNMDLIMGVSDQILVLDYGSRLAEGTPAEIQANPAVISAYLGGGNFDALD